MGLELNLNETSAIILIGGQRVSELPKISSDLSANDLLLVTVSSENGYISKAISKLQLFSLISSEIGHYETWRFMYENLLGTLITIDRNVFILK